MDVDRHRSARIPRHGSSGGAGWFGEMDLVSTPDLPLMTAVGMGRGGGGGVQAGKSKEGVTVRIGLVCHSLQVTEPKIGTE